MNARILQMLAKEKLANWMLNVGFFICKTATLISSLCTRSDTTIVYQQMENLTFNTSKTVDKNNPPIILFEVILIFFERF